MSTLFCFLPPFSLFSKRDRHAADPTSKQQTLDLNRMAKWNTVLMKLRYLRRPNRRTANDRCSLILVKLNLTFHHDRAILRRSRGEFPNTGLACWVVERTLGFRYDEQKRRVIKKDTRFATLVDSYASKRIDVSWTMRNFCRPNFFQLIIGENGCHRKKVIFCPACGKPLRHSY